MLQIQNTIISDQILSDCFCCNYEECKGICCVEGEGGAPLEEGEEAELDKWTPAVWPLLLESSMQVIKEEGATYIDEEGEKVVNIVQGGHCVFATFGENGECLCAFEKLYREGKIDFMKPLSCSLYPIRLKRHANFVAVNYHKWSICRGAIKKGKRQGIKIYQFLKEPLIRAFGAEWYKELEEQVEPYLHYMRERGYL